MIAAKTLTDRKLKGQQATVTEEMVPIAAPETDEPLEEDPMNFFLIKEGELLS